MKKYCTYCNEEYEFNVKSMKELDNLVCPVCNNKIDKNSKKPSGIKEGNQIEDKIGEGLSSMIYIWWILRWSCVILAFLAYFMLPSPVFYTLSVMCAFICLFQYMNIFTNLLYIIAVSTLTYTFIKTIKGICFGFVIALFIQLFIRIIFGNIISKLIQVSRKG